jgi:hypothetical protein
MRQIEEENKGSQRNNAEHNGKVRQWSARNSVGDDRGRRAKEKCDE